MASVRVLSLRAVNRAFLARQMLLEREVLPAGQPDRTARVVQAIEHLVGLQAQAPFPPYYGLHSRLDGFRPEDLAALITDRSVVRIALMRGTIHLVSARDCLPLRRLLQPVIERGMRGAFGPATVRDVQAWSGLTGLKAVLERLRPSLVTFRDEQGTELFDLPTAPRPGADAPAPVRLTAEFDNLVLSHAERSRVVTPEATRRLYTINGVIPGAVLVDGFVAGMWRLARNREEATVVIEMFGPVRRGGAAQRDALTAEAERVLAFAAPDGAHRVRFAPLAGEQVRKG